MALEVMLAGAQKTNEIRLVGPTIILGLGGTGKDVLLRIRRLMVEEYGRLEDLPFLRFIHMDTDQTLEAQQQYDLKAEDDPLYEMIKFNKYELVDLTTKEDVGDVIRNIKAYPQIKDWFQTKGRMHNLGNLSKGAGQVRMASRMAFALKANDIRGVFQNVMGQLLQAQVAAETQRLGFAFNQGNRNVYVVGSLAGGTGSGVFLDVGFMLKQVLHGFSRLGIFLLPSAFASFAGEHRMKANGYAALMELNHYSFGNSFPAPWDQAGSNLIAPPPYDTTYLIDSENAAGIMASPNELYQMIAESVFHEFWLGSFADKKRSVRINLVQFTQNAYLHPFWAGFDGMAGPAEKTIVGDSFTMRFSTFGQSTISLPAHRIMGACACRLGREIIELWQQQIEESYLEELYTRFLNRQDINFAQGDISLRDGGRLELRQLEDELYWQSKEAGVTWRQFFWNKIQELMLQLQAAPMKSKTEVLDRFITDIETWFGRENSDNKEDWGQVTRDIADTARKYTIQIKEAITNECGRLAGDPRYGISHVLAVLQEFKRVLRSELDNICYVPYFEKYILAWGDETQVHKHDLDQTVFDLRKHEHQLAFRTADVNRDLQLLCREEGDDRGILDSYLYARVSRLICRWGKEICEEIDKFLGKDTVHGDGLLAKYHRLSLSLDEFKVHLSRLKAYFENEKHYSHTKSLLDKSDFDRWYNIWVGGDETSPDYQPRLRVYSADLLHSVFNAQTVTEALDAIRKSSGNFIEYKILKRCKELLTGRAEEMNRRPSVLEALFVKVKDDNERSEIIRQISTMAHSWLHQPTNLGHIGGATVPSGQQKVFYVGVDQNDPYYGQFKSELSRVGSVNDVWEPIGLGGSKSGSIVFFSEVSGLPVFYPRSVSAANGLRQWYNTYYVNPQKMDSDNQDVLHTHKNRFLFNDIIPKTDDQAERYKYAVRAFTLGKILDILRVTKEEDGLRYSYVDNSCSWRPPNIVDLGVGEHDAIDFLFQRDQSPGSEKIYLKINDTAQWIVQQLTQRNMLSLYYLLLEFYRSFVYHPEVDRDDVPGLTLKRYRPQYAAIAHELQRMDEFVAHAQLTPQLLEERRRVTGGKMELSEDEYIMLFQPVCRKSGYYTERNVSNVVGGMSVRVKDAWVLDRERLLGPLPSRAMPESANLRTNPAVQMGGYQGGASSPATAPGFGGPGQSGGNDGMAGFTAPGSPEPAAPGFGGPGQSGGFNAAQGYGMAGPSGGNGGMPGFTAPGSPVPAAPGIGGPGQSGGFNAAQGYGMAGPSGRNGGMPGFTAPGSPEPAAPSFGGPGQSGGFNAAQGYGVAGPSGGNDGMPGFAASGSAMSGYSVQPGNMAQDTVVCPDCSQIVPKGEACPKCGRNLGVM